MSEVWTAFLCAIFLLSETSGFQRWPVGSDAN